MTKSNRERVIQDSRATENRAFAKSLDKASPMSLRGGAFCRRSNTCTARTLALRQCRRECRCLLTAMRRLLRSARNDNLARDFAKAVGWRVLNNLLALGPHLARNTDCHAELAKRLGSAKHNLDFSFQRARSFAPLKMTKPCHQ